MRFLRAVILIISVFTFALNLFADDTRYRPYILASVSEGGIQDFVEPTTSKLIEAGFEIVGEYSPYDGTHIIVFTNNEVKENALKTEFGGFGAALRLSLTEVEKGTQISYLNPIYMAFAYRMENSLDTVADLLAETLGDSLAFGSKKGMKSKKLRKYKYVPGGLVPMPMPKFDDHDVLGEFESYEKAIAQVEKGLTDQLENLTKVYRVDLPGKDISLFGVGIKTGDGADEKVMSTTDKKELKQSAHLPYEFLVDGTNVIALRGKYRIALSFPDLSMGTFMKIRGAPGDIKRALRKICDQE
jgi:hypothetical protein